MTPARCTSCRAGFLRARKKSSCRRKGGATAYPDVPRDVPGRWGSRCARLGRAPSRNPTKRPATSRSVGALRGILRAPSTKRTPRPPTRRSPEQPRSTLHGILRGTYLCRLTNWPAAVPGHGALRRRAAPAIPILSTVMMNHRPGTGWGRQVKTDLAPSPPFRRGSW